MKSFSNQADLSAQEQWTEVITANSNWLDLKFAELWQYRDLVRLLVWRDFVASYKQTILGPAWLFINPLLSSVIFTLIFSVVANIGTEGTPPFLFQLCSMTCWNFFLRCFSSTQNTFSANASIFSKVYFPRLAVPIAGIISNFIQLVILLVLFMGCFIVYKFILGAAVAMSWQGLVLLPCILCLLALLATGLGAIVAAFTTKYRDFGIFVGYAIQALMYSSTVVYPLSFFDKYRDWLLLNPLVSLIEAFRYAFLNIGGIYPVYLLYTAVLSIVIFLVGIVLFNQTEKTFIDTV
jgi:lipopolysaccharide transport system permease protein